MEYIVKEVIDDLKNPGSVVRVECIELPTEKELLSQCTNEIFFFRNEKEKIVIFVKKTNTKKEFLEILQKEKIGIKTKATKESYRIPVDAINRLYAN